MSSPVCKFKPLDIVRTSSNGIAVVQEVSSAGDKYTPGDGLKGFQVSLTFLNGQNPSNERNAWWKDADNELTLIDSIPRIISNMIAHTFGTNTKQGNKFFPLDSNTSRNVEA